MLHQAKRDKIFRTNPAEDVKNFKTDVSIAKDVLTIEELQVLANTHCGNESVKRAFLFCCNTGLRFVDVKALKWENIKDNVLKVEQSKTKDKATDGGVVEITLNDTAIKLLGIPTKNEDLVFNLPTHNSTVKSLDYWAKRGGIEKHITFHVARHTFGTLLAHYETDVITISKLLGHTTLKHTSKYIRTSNEMKQKAVNSIPTIHF
jgi:integrase/recombinase XerD